MKDEKFKKSETKTNSPVNSTQPSNAASSPLSMCNDNALNGINNNVVNRNQMLDLEKELFAFKRLNIPSTTVTTAMTTTTTATVTTSLNYSSNPISNMEQQPQQNNISMTLSLSDDTISSLLTSSLHRPIILWGFDNNEQGKNSGIVNSAVVAKNSHCLRQWHPDVLENIHCLDTHSVFSNCKAQKHTLSLSSSPSSTTSSLGVAVAPDLSPPISPITPTGPQHQQPNTHQLNYADHQSMTSIAWDYTSELKCLPVLEYAKLSIIPCELINIPLVTSVSILHATSMRKKEIDKLLVELNENNDENTKEIHTLEGINTEHTKVSNVLRMVSKLSDSNLFITSLSQNAKEKVSSASESSSSSFLPLLRRKQKESNDSFNICLPNTTVSSSSSSGSRDDSSSDLPTSLTTSSHLPRMILTNSTIVDTHECMNSDNGIVSETTEDSINSWKRNHTTPLMNMKMRHIEQRKSTYADLLMMTNNQNTTTNTVILPERSHSTRSSYRISSTRLRPDDSWIMNFTDCTNENVLSTSMITATDTSTATTATTMMMEMTTSSASTSMFLSSSCSKITTLHTSPSSLSPPTSNHQSVLSSSITSNPSNINSTESQIKVNNSEKLKTRSKSRDRMICKSAYGQLESPSNSLLLNKPIGTTIKTAKPTVMPISNNDIDGGGGLFTRNSSSPTLLMLNSVDSTNSTDYYVSQKSTYPPVPPCRPVRRVINWPPPPRIDPITVTESYCS
ncbi:unnamed protein product [Heterobilharzia americana]|nr:unnamed protein product [Heterobilharzia americana]